MLRRENSDPWLEFQSLRRADVHARKPRPPMLASTVPLLHRSEDAVKSNEAQTSLLHFQFDDIINRTCLGKKKKVRSPSQLPDFKCWQSICWRKTVSDLLKNCKRDLHHSWIAPGLTKIPPRTNEPWTQDYLGGLSAWLFTSSTDLEQKASALLCSFSICKK